MVGTEYLNADRHVVQFYRHDEELTERVAGCLLEALEAAAQPSSSRLRSTAASSRTG